MPEESLAPDEKHGHYYREFHGHKIDFYRLVDLFGPLDSAQQHALKKLLFAGDRPHKDKVKDINEVIDSCRRWLEMLEEDETDTTQAEDTDAARDTTALNTPLLLSVLARARGDSQPTEDTETAEVEERPEDEEARGDQSPT